MIDTSMVRETVECRCRICKRANDIRRLILPHLDEDGKKLMEDIMSELESVSTDLDWKNGKGKDGEKVRLGGRWYVPMQPLRKRRKPNGYRKIRIKDFDGTKRTAYALPH